MIASAARLSARTRPEGHVVGHQRWNDLLFLHWHVCPDFVQSTLPEGLTVDTFDGHAYLGIVPFFMERVRPRWLPPLPWLSWFQELNLRTYVHDAHGRPGVLFYSLDCNQPVAVALARHIFHLPYFHANMTATRASGHVEYTCQRIEAEREAPARFNWQAHGPKREAVPRSLEFFLVERYYLFTQSPTRGLMSGQVHHPPYQIRDVTVFSHSVTPAEQAGFTLHGEPVSALCAEAVDVAIYPLKPCCP